MKNQQLMQYAVMCLQVLDEHAATFLSPSEISKSQGIPVRTCDMVLERLYGAGLIDRDDSGTYALRTPVEELKVLDILKAVCMPTQALPAFKMLYAHQRGARRNMLVATRWLQEVGAYPHG